MEDARRKFMRQMASTAMGTAVAPLGAFYASGANAAVCEAGGLRTRGFGAPVAQLPVNSADLGDIVSGQMVDRQILSVPPGFSYTVVSGIGQPMQDRTNVPGNMDGMAAFQRKTGRVDRDGDPIYNPIVYLVRNHEIEANDNLFGELDGVSTAPGRRYDRALSAGGTTNVMFDSRTKRVLRQWVSLSGTLRNCGGGKTPWDTWISCEEDISNPLDNEDTVSRGHGYAFEVPPFGPKRPTKAIPIYGMGRFRREAIAIDPVTTTVFQTEDRSNSCFYAFVPDRRNRAFGQIRRSGKLFALEIIASQRATCDNSALPFTVVNGRRVVDTSRGMQSFLGQPLRVRWTEIEDPTPLKDTMRVDAQTNGASIFNRGEGMIFDDEKRIAYFTATKGGEAGTGQIWAYDTRRETLTLTLESTGITYMDSPDNIVIGPDGETIYINEDASRRSHVLGMTPEGRVFRMVGNMLTRGEMTGICFSPDGKLMFVNIQQAALTCCIYRDDGGKIVL